MFRLAHQADVDGVGFQQLQRLVGRLAGDADVDARMSADKTGEVGQEHIPTERGADADAQGARVRGGHTRQLMLGGVQGGESFLYILPQQFPLRCQDDTLGTADKEPDIQCLLQFFDGFAEGGLADKKLLRGL